MLDKPEGHSPLGASGTTRWWSCPGSVPLSVGCADTESEFAFEGTCAHLVGDAAHREDCDAWEFIGDDDLSFEVTSEMADAVQSYLDAVRLEHPGRTKDNHWIERSFYCPNLHPKFYGTADFVFYDEEERTLHVWDYKHGAGIVIEVEKNKQCLYYACGALEVLELWGHVDFVIIHISQPRGFHFDGPNRSWGIATEDLRKWLFDGLIPAMERADNAGPDDTKSGEHCRFCPARSYACPQLMSDVEELAEMIERLNKKGGAGKLKLPELGHLMDLFASAKIVNTAAQKTAFARMSNGKVIPGYKLVKSRSNREYKPGADKAAKKTFGAERYNPAKLRSPAQMEELQGGKKFNERWAHKPDKGLTLAPESDVRQTVKTSAKDNFTKVEKGK